MRKSLFLMVLMITSIVHQPAIAQRDNMRVRKNVPLDSIRLSDPAILADQKTKMYYMTGTGGMIWRSTDLKLWEGPFRVTEFEADSWMGARPMIWAAELHQTGTGWYYYFATFTNQAVKIGTVKGNVIERRASQVLRADNPMGPYRTFGDATYLPADRPTLDGTYWKDKDGKPYMVFCGEWLQNWNGTIEKIELKPDLSGTVGEPKVLFRASDSPWSRERDDQGKITWNKVTDGPYLFRTETGRLGMVWTSWVFDVYTQGVAYSESGTLDGPWIQEPDPITPPGYGHSMLFQRFDGQWMMSVHHHSQDARGRTVRIPHLFEVDLSGDKLVVKTTTKRNSIRSGEIWPDDRGIHINAHGGGVLKHGDTYYWFGEHKSERTSDALVGVTCYASEDLLNWRYCGVALSVSEKRGHDIERGCILERPKVIFNPVTKKFCMWFHLELKGQGYDAARYGVAVADRPEGPYEFLYSQRSDAGKWPMEFSEKDIAVADTLAARHYKDWTPAWTKAVSQGLIVKRDLATGQMSRDMTLYVDDDGKAYHIFSSEENLTLHIAELTEDYLHHSGRYTRVAPAGHNEAPAIFKHDGTYWMITSGCTGWAPNEARMFSAPSIWGPWTQHPNPCRGPKAELTFGGQSTYILPVGNRYIFMADIWRPRRPINARYIWLPIEFEDGKPVIRWRDEWSF